MTPIHLAAAGTSAAWPPSHRPSQAWLSCTLTQSGAPGYRAIDYFLAPRIQVKNGLWHMPHSPD